MEVRLSPGLVFEGRGREGSGKQYCVWPVHDFGPLHVIILGGGGGGGDPLFLPGLPQRK